MADEKGPPLPENLLLGPTLLEQPPTEPAILKKAGDDGLAQMHYAAIGRVAANWSYLEAVVDTWLGAFAGFKDHETSVCFTSQLLGIRPRLDAFIALAKHQLGSDRWTKRLETFANTATELSEKRNRAVHDIWLLHDPSAPRRIEASAKRKVRLLTHSVPTDSLERLAGRFLEFQGEFDDMASAIFAEIHISSPDTDSPEPHQ